MPQELQNEFIQSLFSDPLKRMEFFTKHPWILIPDLQLEWLQKGFQGTYMNLDLGPAVPTADFAIHFHLQGKLYLQLVRLDSPDAHIVNEYTRSNEFNQTLEDVESWALQIAEKKTPFQELLADPRVTVMYRIVIGRSSQFTEEEKIELRACRTNELRIRTYDWLLDKASEFSSFMVKALDACGPPKSSANFIESIPELLKRTEGPTPPYLS